MDTVDTVDCVDTVLCAVQVTACSSLVCGPGVCTVGSVGPVCDCTGTGTTGPHCEAVTDPSPSPAAAPTPPSAATAGAPRSSPTRSPTPSPVPSPTALPLLPCPGTVNGEVPCRGHGACSRSVAGCTVSNLECVASCRWVARGVYSMPLENLKTQSRMQGFGLDRPWNLCS